MAAAAAAAMATICTSKQSEQSDAKNMRTFVDEHTKDQPPCKGCGESWPYPRNVEYRLLSEVPARLRADTPKCIVAFQTRNPKTRQPDFPLSVIQYMSHTWNTRSGKNRLNLDFEYCKASGQVFFDTAKQEDGSNGYARLITLNSWYSSLCSSAVFMCLSTMDLQATFSFCVELLINDNEFGQFFASKYVFVVIWLALLLVNLAIAVREASLEWRLKSSALVGDLITECHRFDNWSCFFALVTFRFFFVEMQVKDIVILLHPWKAVQPFAAVKMENARSYLVGFKDEYLFRVQNRAGQELGLPVQLLSKLAICGFKGWLAYWGNATRWQMLAASLSTFGSLLWLIHKYRMVSQDRKKCKRSLLNALKNGEEREREGARRMLLALYKIEVDENGCEKALSKKSADFLSGVAISRAVTLSDSKFCGQCGRDPEDLPLPATPASVSSAKPKSFGLAFGAFGGGEQQLGKRRTSVGAPIGLDMHPMISSATASTTEAETSRPEDLCCAGGGPNDGDESRLEMRALFDSMRLPEEDVAVESCGGTPDLVSLASAEGGLGGAHFAKQWPPEEEQVRPPGTLPEGP